MTDTYTPLFKEQILEVVSTREVTHNTWWSPELHCGCPLTELARAHGFDESTTTAGYGGDVLDFNTNNFGHSFNMQSAFIEAFDADFSQTTLPPLTAYEICERDIRPVMELHTDQEICNILYTTYTPHQTPIAYIIWHPQLANPVVTIEREYVLSWLSVPYHTIHQVTVAKITDEMFNADQRDSDAEHVYIR